MDKNNEKESYWEEFSAWTEYDDYRAYPEREEQDLDAIISAVLNDGKIKDMPKSYDNFEEFWTEVKAFADQYRLSYAYVEEEFVIDGELIPVHLTFPDDPLM
tara:strand:- start:462 stop:767 length:306 start_codon:yes stop_codon:yes gene_type:complete